MDLQKQPDGRMHFSLGPMEKWGVGLAGVVLTAGLIWLVSSVQTLLTQQAVTNQQLLTIGSQLTDVPQLRSQNAEMKIRVERLEQDVRELRQTRAAR